MTNRSPKFISLFSGCGGFDLGFASRGFTPLSAYDIDSDALSNYTANIDGNAKNTDLSLETPHTDGRTNLDALIAGPPCQGFSTAGKRRLDDDRNRLLPLTGEIACQLKPKVLVVENVTAALSGKHAKYWEELVCTMQSAGYRTHTVRYNATQLGMAQMRKRIILYAWNTKKDLHVDLPAQKPATLRSVITGASRQRNHKISNLEKNSREWLIAQRIKQGQKLSNVRGGENSVATWDIPEVFGAISTEERTILELLRRLRRQERKRDHGDADPVSLPRLEAALGKQFKIHLNSLINAGYIRRVGDDVDLSATFNGKYRRLSWGKPSCTVDTRFGSPRYFLHPSKNRGFTVREAARIQGFPDSYIFTGNEKSQYRMIGNAVPPPLGEHAADVTKHLLGIA